LPSIAKLTEAQGAVGIGPVTKAAEVRPALKTGVGVLMQGGVCVIDFHVDPNEERKAGTSAGQRATGTAQR
jgi:thiamine pyrophosphate-dependent acetolactate synthase large subunit-like protein